MKKKAKPQGSFKKYNRLLLVGVILVAAIGAIIYGSYLEHVEKQQAIEDRRFDAEDKQRFETVRGKVATLHDRLDVAAGPREEWKTRIFCNEGSVKFGEGEKACFVKTETSIGVTDDQQANTLIAKYRSIFDQASDLFKFERDFKPTPPSFPSRLVAGLDGAVYRERLAWHAMVLFE